MTGKSTNGPIKKNFCHRNKVDEDYLLLFIYVFLFPNKIKYIDNY